MSRRPLSCPQLHRGSPADSPRWTRFYRRTSLAALAFLPPIFVRPPARPHLRAFDRREGGIVKDVPEVLFVCIHNAGRSQMAAALLDHHAQGRVRVRSGGSAPGERINPAVAEAMAEVGLDLSMGR